MFKFVLFWGIETDKQAVLETHWNWIFCTAAPINYNPSLDQIFADAPIPANACKSLQRSYEYLSLKSSYFSAFSIG